VALIGAVVMAAGASRRFGSDKRMFDDGESPLLQKTLAHVLLLKLPTILVLRPQDELLAKDLMGGHHQNTLLSVFYAANPERGMGANMAQIFESPPGWDGALIFLGDMAWINPETSLLVIDSFDCESIVVPVHKGRHGHPVLFPKSCYSKLAALEGEPGGKHLLQAGCSRLTEVHVDDKNIMKDLNTLV
jgi:molybdenum cofactor cytidylyltransferase